MSDMGSPAPFGQPRRADQPIVAFDFDGTTTVKQIEVAQNVRLGGFTVNSGTSRKWVMHRPVLRIASTCSGQGSMKVTSSPAWTIWAPA